ncbi:MAG: hypothetical protein ACOZQL_23635 [Myxococcota bacterium]
MLRTTLLAGAVALAGCADRTRLVEAYASTGEVVVACVEGDFTLEAVTPSVMLVLDRSASMASSLGSGTRWSTLVGALETALPPVDDSMELGLALFPAAGGQECRVADAPELWPASGQVDALLARVRSSTLVGGTPTALALDAAAAALTTERPRAMVLATDGLPNCNGALSLATCACPAGTSCLTAQRCIDDARTLERLAVHADEGVPTWIIGIGDDVTSSAILDAMAIAGGRPARGAHRFVAASSPAELQAAFVGIRDELSSCTYTSPSVPEGTGSMVLTLDGAVVPEDASGASGWTWSSRARGELVLRGTWCQQAIAAAAPTVKISVVCAEPADGGSGAVIAN